ncbi:MAG: hypothetical protein PHP34_06580 [Bacteroidales bacterium]|nr:hypothetical protein [Bacteroidales bacterium]
MRLLIIPLLFLICTCTSGFKNQKIKLDNGITLYQDTISIDVKGKMTHALKYQNKYYVLFEEFVKHNYGGYDKRWLYIFSDGKVEQKVDLPKLMDVAYLDFFVRNDTIILKPYMDDASYFLDTQSYKWKNLDKSDDLIYEDKKYLVYSRDFGEWGGKTWFKDKKTGFEYEIEARTPLVTSVDTNYYLTNSYQIFKIANPLLLNKCNDDVSYEKIETSGKCYVWYGDPIGFEIYFRDTTYCPFEFKYKPSIVSSIVMNNEFLQVYETDSATYLAKIINDSILPVQKIAESLRFFNMYNSFRCRNSSCSNELLKFETEDKQFSGLLDIVDKKIHLLYFSNKTELYPKSFGPAKAKDIFVQHFNLVLSNLNSLKLKDIEEKEKKWRSYENTPNHVIGIGESWNPKKFTIDAFKSFLIQEDSVISFTTEYFATKKSDLVRTVLFEWFETDDFKLLLDETIEDAFKSKSLYLEDFITQKVGKSIRVNHMKNVTEKIWKTTDGLTIELESMKEYNNIRLVIFQNK